MSYKNARNPQDLPCWRGCTSCGRCANKGMYISCQWCSGRCDPELKKPTRDIDDKCKCSDGIFQYRMKNGYLLVTVLPQDPFKGSITPPPDDPDERDWRRWLQEQREYLQDSNWNPIQYDDGTPID